MTAAVAFLILLQVKHFVCDFPLQGPFQYKNKGTYGHPGGLLHAGIHMLGTIAVFAACGFTWTPDILLIVVIEPLIHYHIDWAKMRLNAHFGWGPTTSERFWWLLGFDQLLHQLTYVWMIWSVMTLT